MTDDASKPARKRVKRKARPQRARTDSDFVAQVVADSVLLGTDAAAAKHGISARSVRRYRERADSGRSPELTASVQEKKADLVARSREKTLALIDFLDGCMREAAPIAAKLGKLYEVAGAYKIASDRLGADRITEAYVGDEKPAAPAAETPHPSGLRVVTGGR